MTAYDPQNPFAKILRGEFPSYKVYEDDHVLAFLDIMPRCTGHTLVIPKAPARNILDIKPDDFAHVARAAHKIAGAGMKAFDADGMTVQQFSEPAGGQVVFHLTCPCDAAPQWRGVIAAGEPQGRRQGTGGECGEACGGATEIIAAVGWMSAATSGAGACCIPGYRCAHPATSSSSFRGARSASPESISQHSRSWNKFRARRSASPRNDDLSNSMQT